MSSSTASNTNQRRRIGVPSAPVYSPNETLNQMTKEADNRQEDTMAVQREARQIRIELERQRIESEKQRKQNDTCEETLNCIKIETEIDDVELDDDDDCFIEEINLNLNESSSLNKLVENNDEERDDEYSSSSYTNGSRYPTSTSNNSLNNGIYTTNGSTSNSTKTTTSASGLATLSKNTTPYSSNLKLSSTDSTLSLLTATQITSVSSGGSDDISNNPRELKKKLTDMEEKYKKHAIYQTQLENDNQKLLYEVDCLKDQLDEYEEQIIELKRQSKEKDTRINNQKRELKDHEQNVKGLKELIKQRDELLLDTGYFIYTDMGGIEKNECVMIDNHDDIKSVLPAALLSSKTNELLDALGEGTIDEKLKKLLDEKQEFKEQINKLKSDLEDERFRIVSLEKKLTQTTNRINENLDVSQGMHEMQRTFTKEINDLKLKIQKLEHDNILLKQEKTRLETQHRNMQLNFEELEQREAKISKEKREITKEYRELKTKHDDQILETKRLQDRFDSLEFYAKTSSTSGAFHNLNITPTTTSTSASSTSSTHRTERGRSPMPIVVAPRRASLSRNSILSDTYETKSTNGTSTKSSTESSTSKVNGNSTSNGSASNSTSSRPPIPNQLASSISLLKLPPAINTSATLGRRSSRWNTLTGSTYTPSTYSTLSSSGSTSASTRDDSILRRREPSIDRNLSGLSSSLISKRRTSYVDSLKL